ncbi:MAG TPA: TonB-dependent receptor plug domain-containing protein, partial [Methylomirabilota bacterium]|nr:TonB-dependent receptor plug domain-containing protein [Methylomirabilota bacterium]
MTHPPTSSAPGRFRGRGLLVALALLCLAALPAFAKGRVQGRVLAADTHEPVAFADVLLIPADTTLARVGGLTNVDGTFTIEAVAGTYAVQVRALSYARKLFENVVLADSGVVALNADLSPEAIMQKEVLVEAKAKLNTETGVLTERRKAGTVGDAVSAEQVRRSGDRNAADVLRRVTGLSVSDGKYVYVRGLGERYSSTEVDGVRIASPEQNKRVVPLDLVPASLLENVVVQKTYTADRPGEFGGGDVEVRTKDFPGKRTWAFSISQGIESGVTFQDRMTYTSTAADIFGFGAGARALPGAITEIGDVKLA